jgi:hypothetical protein
VDRLGRLITARAAHVAEHLFDHQLDVGPETFVLEDRDVLEAHQGLEDLTRVDEDEGASCFLAHASSLKRLRLILGDLGGRGSPLKSEKPLKVSVSTSILIESEEFHEQGRSIS